MVWKSIPWRLVFCHSSCAVQKDLPAIMRPSDVLVAQSRKTRRRNTHSPTKENYGGKTMVENYGFCPVNCKQIVLPEFKFLSNCIRQLSTLEVSYCGSRVNYVCTNLLKERHCKSLAERYGRGRFWFVQLSLHVTYGFWLWDVHIVWYCNNEHHLLSVLVPQAPVEGNVLDSPTRKPNAMAKWVSENVFGNKSEITWHWFQISSDFSSWATRPIDDQLQETFRDPPWQPSDASNFKALLMCACSSDIQAMHIFLSTLTPPVPIYACLHGSKNSIFPARCKLQRYAKKEYTMRCLVLVNIIHMCIAVNNVPLTQWLFEWSRCLTKQEIVSISREAPNGNHKISQVCLIMTSWMRRQHYLWSAPVRKGFQLLIRDLQK